MEKRKRETREFPPALQVSGHQRPPGALCVPVPVSGRQAALSSGWGIPAETNSTLTAGLLVLQSLVLPPIPPSVFVSQSVVSCCVHTLLVVQPQWEKRVGCAASFLPKPERQLRVWSSQAEALLCESGAWGPIGPHVHGVRSSPPLVPGPQP